MLLELEGDSESKSGAAYWLGEVGWGNEQVAHALGALLEDPTLKVRKASAEALGKIGPVANPYLPLLERIAAHDPDCGFAAVVSMCRLLDSAAPLARLTALPSDKEECPDALDYLAWLGPRADPVLPLLERARGFHDDPCIMQVVFCIWRIDGNDQKAIDTYLSLLEASSDALQVEALGYLYRVSPRAASAELARLTGIIQRREAIVQACDLIKELHYGSPELIQALLDVTPRRDDWAGASAAAALAAILDQPDAWLAQELRERLFLAADELDPARFFYTGHHIRDLCDAYISAETEPNQACNTIAELLGRRNVELRLSVVLVVPKLKTISPVLLESLLACAQETESDLPRKALEVIGELGPRALSIESGLREIRDDDTKWSWEAAQALQRVNGSEDELLDYAEDRLRLLDQPDETRGFWELANPMLQVTEQRGEVPARSRDLFLKALKEHYGDEYHYVLLRRTGITGEDAIQFLPLLATRLRAPLTVDYDYDYGDIYTGPQVEAILELGSIAAYSPEALKLLVDLIPWPADEGLIVTRAQKYAMCHALGEAGPAAAPRALPWLVVQLQDEDALVSLAAAGAIDKISGRHDLVLSRLEYWAHFSDITDVEGWFDYEYSMELGPWAASLLPIMEQRWRWEMPKTYENSYDNRAEIRRLLSGSPS